MTRLIVTIDTEEDLWGAYTVPNPPVENIKELPKLQAIFNEYGVRPTYLVTYPVATDPDSLAILQSFATDGRCEIGAHLHPWNTPPISEETNERNSMLCNLSSELQLQKLETLRAAIRTGFGHEPKSFRAGRWGYSAEVAENLTRVGIKVDSSVYPYMDWSYLHGPDFSSIPLKKRWRSIRELFGRGHGSLLEIAATSLLVPKQRRRIPPALAARPRLGRLLRRRGLVRLTWLSPENEDANGMIDLSQRLIRRGFPYLNLFFHSPTLSVGLTPFVRTVSDQKAFYERIRSYLEFIRARRIPSMLLCEALND